MAVATASPEVAPLISVLTREQAIYQKLLEVAAEERQAIVAGDLPELKAVLLRKQDILEQLAALEDRRISWLGRYSRKHGVDLETMTLASIIESSGQPDRQLLTRLHRGLRRRIDRLVGMNGATKALLEKILGSIDVSLRFLLAEDGSGQTYGAQGQLQAGAVLNRQLLECQA